MVRVGENVDSTVTIGSFSYVFNYPPRVMLLKIQIALVFIYISFLFLPLVLFFLLTNMILSFLFH